MTDTEKARLKPTIWIRRAQDLGYELYLHNPLGDRRWELFETFEDLVDWLRENPGVLLSKEDLAGDFLQLSFSGMEKGKPWNG